MGITVVLLGIEMTRFIIIMGNHTISDYNKIIHRFSINNLYL